MTSPIKVRSTHFFDQLSPKTQIAVLIVLVGLVLFLATALDSGGETAFMYATF